MASLTRSVSIRPFFLRLLMSSSLVSPELRHAMLKALNDGYRRVGLM